MMSNVPEPTFYSLSLLAKKWNCGVDDLLHYGVTGQLNVSVLTMGWWLEKGAYDYDGDARFRVPEGHVFSQGQLIKISPLTVQKFVGKESVTDPIFIIEEDRYCYISEERHLQPVVINLKDLMVSMEDALSFEGEKKDQPGSEYTTPFIQLLLRAINHFELSRENQLKSKTIAEWLVKQSSPSCQISPTMAAGMATLVRLPESGNGGNKRLKNIERVAT